MARSVRGVFEDTDKDECGGLRKRASEGIEGLIWRRLHGAQRACCVVQEMLSAGIHHPQSHLALAEQAPRPRGRIWSEYKGKRTSQIACYVQFSAGYDG